MKILSKYISACLLATSMLLGNAALAQTSPMPASDSLYQAFGGKDGMFKMVNDFVDIIAVDPRLKPAFVDADLERTAAMLNEQFCELTGGPCTYSGKDMKTTHAKLKISNAQFNALAEDLQTAMDMHGIPSRAQNKLLAKLAPMQRDVVTK